MILLFGWLCSKLFSSRNADVIGISLSDCELLLPDIPQFLSFFISSLFWCVFVLSFLIGMGRREKDNINWINFFFNETSHGWVIKKEMGFQFTQDWVQCSAFLRVTCVTLGTLLSSPNMFPDVETRKIISPSRTVVCHDLACNSVRSSCLWAPLTPMMTMIARIFINIIVLSLPTSFNLPDF